MRSTALALSLEASPWDPLDVIYLHWECYPEKPLPPSQKNLHILPAATNPAYPWEFSNRIAASLLLISLQKMTFIFWNSLELGSYQSRETCIFFSEIQANMDMLCIVVLLLFTSHWSGSYLVPINIKSYPLRNSVTAPCTNPTTNVG